MEQTAVNQNVIVDLVAHLIDIFDFAEPIAKHYALEILSNIQ
jgi:hypothetical protein